MGGYSWYPSCAIKVMASFGPGAGSQRRLEAAHPACALTALSTAVWAGPPMTSTMAR